MQKDYPITVATYGGKSIATTTASVCCRYRTQPILVSISVISRDGVLCSCHVAPPHVLGILNTICGSRFHHWR